MPATKPPLTQEHIDALFARLHALSEDDKSSVIWQTFGGMEHAALNSPNLRVREFFDTLEARLAEVEAKAVKPLAA